MHKDLAKIEIEKHMQNDESLVGFFMAVKRPPFLLFFLMGPLASLGFRTYVVGVTNLGIHFHKLDIWGKFSQHDFFAFNEIKDIRVGKGYLQTPIKYTFVNGEKLKIFAQKKGVEKIAKISDNVIIYLNEHIKAA